MHLVTKRIFEKTVKAKLECNKSRVDVTRRVDPLKRASL